MSEKKELERFNFEVCNCALGVHSDTVKDKDGEYVRYSDYESLESRLKEVEYKNQELCAGWDMAIKRFEEAEQRLSQAEAELDKKNKIVSNLQSECRSCGSIAWNSDGESTWCMLCEARKDAECDEKKIESLKAQISHLMDVAEGMERALEEIITREKIRVGEGYGTAVTDVAQSALAEFRAVKEKK